MVWDTNMGGIGGELNTSIIRIQKRMIRSMVEVSSKTSCRQLFKELNILTLGSLHILEVTCFVRKYCQSDKQNFKVHTYNTQRKMNIHVKLHNNEYIKRV